MSLWENRKDPSFTSLQIAWRGHYAEFYDYLASDFKGRLPRSKQLGLLSGDQIRRNREDLRLSLRNLGLCPNSLSINRSSACAARPERTSLPGATRNRGGPPRQPRRRRWPRESVFPAHGRL